MQEYAKTIMLKWKIQTMKRFKYFLTDVERNETRSMAEYCNGPGHWFLEELDEYYNDMKNMLQDAGKWNLRVVLILGKTGTGKSTLCNLLAGNLPKQNYSTGGFVRPDYA